MKFFYLGGMIFFAIAFLIALFLLIQKKNFKKSNEQALLGRKSVEVDLSTILEYVKDRIVLVTGGGGSIGSELCRQLAIHSPKKLLILDIYENNAYAIFRELQQDFPDLNQKILIASVRDKARMEEIFEKYQPDLIYHAAAHKHVALMEENPAEAIKNNVFGTWITASLSAKYKADRFVLISTDKAVNPTNIMGASKRICEMIVQYLGAQEETRFATVRFGNVLDSNGSVIPLFREQIRRGGPVTVTHPEVIRYFMTIPEAVSLVLQAGAYAKEDPRIFVLDMGDPVKIDTLAKTLIRQSGKKISIRYTGLLPGEKLYEELLLKEEGLERTENNLIYIGKPIPLDCNQFLSNLEALNDAIEKRSDFIYLIENIVPTYKKGAK